MTVAVHRLKKSRQTIEARPLSEEHLEVNSLASNTMLLGHIDGVIDGRLQGWILLQDDAVALILMDDAPLGTTQNDLWRDDVIEAGFAKGPVGFSYEVPIALQD